MKIVTFNAQEIEIDAIQAVDTMAFTFTQKSNKYEMMLKKL